MKEKISNSLFFAGLFILLFIVTNVVVSTTLFIFKISITSSNLIVSFIITIIGMLFIINKKKQLDFSTIIMSIVVPILIIFGSFYLEGKVADFSYDGNTYHKTTIGLLKDGWNPIYQTSSEFDESRENKLGIKDNETEIWVDHYARASHIFQANVYSFWGKIESGKAINMLSMVALFFMIISILLLKTKKVIASILFTLCAVTQPIVCSQIFTNYIDFLIYAYMMFLLLYFFMIEFSENKIDKKLGMAVYIMSLTMLINIKFSSFAYAGFYSLGYYIYYIIKLKNKKMQIKEFMKFTITTVVTLLVSIFIVGLAVYPKNILSNGHPFYPLFGENKIDIMTANQPDYFKKKSAIEKFTISMFSRVDNISEASGLEAEYKIPFTIQDEELSSLKSADSRISGNGVFFGGILIISLIMLIVLSIECYKKNKTLFYMCSIPLMITFLLAVFLSESWWARYFTQIYFVVLVDLLYLIVFNNKIKTLIFVLFTLLVLSNNIINLGCATGYSYIVVKQANMEYQELREKSNPKTDKILISTPTFFGASYDVLDKLPEYEIERVVMSEEDIVNSDILMSGLVYYKIVPKYEE